MSQMYEVGLVRPDSRAPLSFTEQMIDFSNLPFSTTEGRLAFEVSMQGFQHQVHVIRQQILSTKRFPSLEPIKYYDAPTQTHLPNSDSWYVAEEEFGDGHNKTWLGIYLLFPGEHTSGHDHPHGVVERYYVLRGNLILVIDGQKRVLNEMNKHTVYQGQDHFALVEDGRFAAVSVEMSGVNGYSPEERHRNSRRIFPLDPIRS